MAAGVLLEGIAALPGGRRHGHGGQASRLGVARLRTEVLPPLSREDDLLVLTPRAYMPSFLRYGAYPYIVVVRERPDIEHRFVGLFTAAASNANVLGSRSSAGASRPRWPPTSKDDPNHPGQLLLDIFQTIPRSELFSLDSAQLLEMARR